MVALTVSTQVDDASIRKSAVDIQRRYERIGQEVGGDFMSAFANGARSNSPKLEKAMDGAKDATGKLRLEQEKLDDLLARGESNRTKLIQQSERTAKAKRDEERAIRQAAAAYKEYGDAGEGAGGSFVGGLRGSIAGAGSSGKDMANEFVGGFAGASALTRLGAAGGPIGLALAGVVTLGVVAGKQLATAIADGLDTIQLQDQFQSRMGLNEAQMSQYASAAGKAYASNYGASVQDNLGAAQAALRSGLINPGDNSAQVQGVVEDLQGLARTTEATAAESSRSITTLIRTGLAGSVSQASDIITAGFQSGLDVSGDWLDTINEYSTQFRKFGLSAEETMTLLKQGLEGGARDTDKVADSLKEFSIRAVDGSKTTAEGFKALGFNADEMGQRFAAGGASAHTALGSVFDALKQIDDPMQQALIWQRLFGTQFEDMGDAINRFTLDPAANQFRDLQGTSDRATKTATDNFKSEWEEATRTVGQFFSDLKTDIAEWFSDLPVIKDLPGAITALFGNHDFKGPPIPTAPPVYGPPLPAPVSGPPMGGGLGDLLNPGAGSSGSGLPDVLNGPQLAPPGSGNYYKRLYPQQPVNAGPPAPVPGERTPIVPDDGSGSGGSKSKPSFDPSKWTLDSIPFGSFPGEEGLSAGAPAPGPMVPGTGPGSFQVDPQRVFDAQTSQMNAQTSLQNARYRYLEVMADADATEQDKYNAKSALVAQGRSLQSAEAKLAEAQQGTWKKMETTANSFSQGMDKVGAALDADFGLGDGISGFVENLIKAAGNLAAAPLLGQLNAISQANPIQGGYGALGMFGAQNIAAGKSPLGFGQSQYGNYAAAAMGPAALQPGGYSGNVAAMLGLAQASSGNVKYAPASDLVNGLADCSGSISDLVETLQNGRPNSGRLFTTTNFASDAEAAKLGFLPGYQPGALNVGVTPLPGSSGHMAATLPNGVNFEGGGSTGGGAQYGGSAVGALDSQFSKRYYMPVGGPVIPSPAATSTASPIALPTPTAADIYSPANTNPALTPALPAAGLPAFGGGGGPMAGGMPQAAPFAAPSVIPGQSPAGPPGSGGGFAGLGGMPMAGLSMAASAADLLMPGAGQAAQTGIQLANRTIGFLGQLGGIAAGGVLETLSVGGGNPLADPMKSLPGRVLAGIMGARPALPNQAGQGQQQAQQQNGQGAPGQQQGQAQPGGPLVEIHGGIHQAPNETPDSVANGMANQLRSAELAGGYKR